jgi:hypothetical protein
LRPPRSSFSPKPSHNTDPGGVSRKNAGVADHESSHKGADVTGNATLAPRQWQRARAATRVLFCLLGAAALAHAGEGSRPRLPRPDHVVIVIEKSCGFSRIIGNPAAPYLNALARRGALLSQSYAVARASQPNHLALFSGSTQDTNDDSCPRTFPGDNLASRLIQAGYTFETYSESLPAPGYAGCVYGNYRRTHNPAVNWQGVNVPADTNLPLSRFPSNYALLPTVTLVVPNHENNMHAGDAQAISRGDAWLRANLDGYVRWARSHKSLLIVTCDQDDGSENNRIPTLFVGPMVQSGVYSARIDHYSTLRTILDMYALPALGDSATARPIKEIWFGAAPAPVSTPR